MMSESMKAGRCIACLCEVFFLWKDVHPKSTNLHNAVDGILYGYYGSCHDTDEIRIFVCDDCVSEYVRVSPASLTTREERVSND